MKKSILKHVIHMTRLFTIAFIIQCLTMSFLLARNGYAQVKSIEEVTVYLSLNEVKVEKAFKELEKQTDYNFVFATREIKDLPLITFESRGQSLYDLLMDIATQANLNFKQVDLNIHVQKSNKDQTVLVAENVDVTITGTVTDTNGEPIPGVTVSVSETTIGTATDVDGNYSLSVPEGSTLVFSFIGFETQRVQVENQSEIDIALNEDMASLDEVVVVGYGTQSKEDVTGSVSNVNTEAVRNLPVSTIDQKMVGQVAGVQIQQVSGAPGAGTSVKIRGSGSLGAGNEPLYVVDGMPYSSAMNQNMNPLLFINPNDIESVTILKDASSSAIYGSRGANGVIMITTKKGNYDQTVVNVSSMRGIQQVPQKGRPNLLNQQEFAELQRDRIDLLVRRQENREPTLNDYPEEYRYPENMVGNGTDWYDLVLQTATVQDHNINVQKGTKDSRLNFSLGYFKQDGTVRYTGVERYSSKLSVESNIGKAVTISATLQPTYIEQTRTNTNADRTDILGVANWANPVMSPHDENGQLKPYIQSPQSKYFSAWSFANPLFVLRETTQSQKDFQNLGSAFIEWQITPELKAKSSLNTIWSTSKYFQYVPSTVGAPNRPPMAGIGMSANSRGETFNWLFENTLTYDKAFDNHRFNALLGYTAQKYTSSGINLNASPYPNDLIQTINAAQEIRSWGQSINEWSMISYLGRVNYAYKDRYLLTATVRSDGSSRFGIENRYALFPAVAGAWRVSEEEFLKNRKVIDDLKLRVSYGESGNNNIGNYSHLAEINSESYVFGSNQVTGSYVGISNPYLTWEESKQIDAGVDLGLFNSRLTLVLDYYHRESKDMLLNDIIPAITGFNSQTINQGNVRNTGLEIALGGTPVAGTFNWDINANIAFNQNKIISLNDNDDRILGGRNDNLPTHISVVGKPIGQFFGFVLEGLYTAEDLEDPNIASYPQVYEGAARYKDINGDGQINDLLDYTIIGNPHPDFIFGITNNFSYKNFDLGIIINGQYGGQVVNGLRQTTDLLSGFFNISKEWTNRWRSAEQPGDGKHHGVVPVFPNLGHRMSSLWIEDATYLRIANLTLGYSLPQRWMVGTGFINNGRFYLTIQNLAMFTNYGGANPEAQAVNRSNTLAPGFDMTSYPLARTASVGVNLSF